jgi:prevent-host-death family protein
MIPVSRTDLARNTRGVIELVRRGRPVVVESYGEEQIVLLDVLDYRLLQAAASYPRGRQAPVNTPGMAPRGLTETELVQAMTTGSGDEQTRWNRVMTAYLDGDINLGRTADLLGLQRFDLMDRLDRLGLPLLAGALTREEALAGLGGLRR